mmetsp:Transcript_61354/g.154915  ORF Transcript_61354/g.154915 Transcript_61354/m.154915 type:complete len:390 (-) Transcript_61354:212-1381(-)
MHSSSVNVWNSAVSWNSEVSTPYSSRMAAARRDRLYINRATTKAVSKRRAVRTACTVSAEASLPPPPGGPAVGGGGRQPQPERLYLVPARGCRSRLHMSTGGTNLAAHLSKALHWKHRCSPGPGPSAQPQPAPSAVHWPAPEASPRRLAHVFGEGEVSSEMRATCASVSNSTVAAPVPSSVAAKALGLDNREAHAIGSIVSFVGRTQGFEGLPSSVRTRPSSSPSDRTEHPSVKSTLPRVHNNWSGCLTVADASGPSEPSPAARMGSEASSPSQPPPSSCSRSLSTVLFPGTAAKTSARATTSAAYATVNDEMAFALSWSWNVRSSLPLPVATCTALRLSGEALSNHWSAQARDVAGMASWNCFTKTFCLAERLYSKTERAPPSRDRTS